MSKANKLTKEMQKHTTKQGHVIEVVFGEYPYVLIDGECEKQWYHIPSGNTRAWAYFQELIEYYKQDLPTSQKAVALLKAMK